MKKPRGLYGFLLFYFGLIGISYLVNVLLFQTVFIDYQNFTPLLHSIAQSSLTASHRILFRLSIPYTYHFFSLLVTQSSGILILSYLLWYYRQLFSSNISQSGFWPAFKLTVKVTLIIELVLVLFFFYAIPIELTDNNYLKKIITVLLLSINSFNNAGLTHIQLFIDPSVLEQNFILQLGIIFGATMGNLGIFVIDELFAPKHLRERLKNPEIDWSMITKLSVFGSAALIIISAGTFYIMEERNYLQGKNLMESLIASVYEIISARGFDHSFSGSSDMESASLVKLFVSIFGSGPFSTGGGLTILWFTLILYLFHKKFSVSKDIRISFQLVKNLILYSLISFGTLYILVLLLNPSVDPLFLLKNQWSIFSTTQFDFEIQSNGISDVLKGLTCIAGRIGFVVASFITLRQIRY